MSELAALAYHVLTKLGHMELLNKAVHLLGEAPLEFPRTTKANSPRSYAAS